MANFLDNFGLGYLLDSGEGFETLITYILDNSEPIIGYSSVLYNNCRCGDALFIARCIINEEEKNIEIVGIDTHSGGYVWDLCASCVEDITPKDADRAERTLMLNHAKTGKGSLIVNVVNADILPSFLENDIVKLQMVAFPYSIHYYSDDESYDNAQPASKLGQKYVLADGSLFPIWYLYNHDPDIEESKKDYSKDDLVQFRGTVKELQWGKVKFGDEFEVDDFVRCIVDTQYGLLEIIHMMEQVDESEYGNIKVGAVVGGLCVLSGNAAVMEHENGMVFDEEHDLRLIRHAFLKGQTIRMLYAFNEDVAFGFKSTGEIRLSRKELVKRLQAMLDIQEQEYFLHMGTIISVDNDNEALPEYKVGKRCIVFARGSEKELEYIAFIDVDDNGKIARLSFTSDYRYRFAVDEIPGKPDFSERSIVPASIIELIILRARYLNIIEDIVDDEDITEELYEDDELRENAELMVEHFINETSTIEGKVYENIFGYLFAKKIELFEESRISREDYNYYDGDEMVNYSPQDAFEGKIRSDIEYGNQKIKDAMDLGKMFYKDFKFFNEANNLSGDMRKEALVLALMTVQKIGTLSAARMMGLL